MLKIEKTLRQIRELQTALKEVGLDITISDSDKEASVAHIELQTPSYAYEWELYPDSSKGRQTFYGYDRPLPELILNQAEKWFERRIDKIKEQWGEICDTSGENFPMPDVLQDKIQEHETSLKKVRELYSPSERNADKYFTQVGVPEDVIYHYKGSSYVIKPSDGDWGDVLYGLSVSTDGKKKWNVWYIGCDSEGRWVTPNMNDPDSTYDDFDFHNVAKCGAKFHKLGAIEEVINRSVSKYGDIED